MNTCTFTTFLHKCACISQNCQKYVQSRRKLHWKTELSSEWIMYLDKVSHLLFRHSSIFSGYFTLFICNKTKLVSVLKSQSKLGRVFWQQTRCREKDVEDSGAVLAKPKPRRHPCFFPWTLLQHKIGIQCARHDTTAQHLVKPKSIRQLIVSWNTHNCHKQQVATIREVSKMPVDERWTLHAIVVVLIESFLQVKSSFIRIRLGFFFSWVFWMHAFVPTKRNCRTGIPFQKDLWSKSWLFLSFNQSLCKTFHTNSSECLNYQVTKHTHTRTNPHMHTKRSHMGKVIQQLIGSRTMENNCLKQLNCTWVSAQVWNWNSVHSIAHWKLLFALMVRETSEKSTSLVRWGNQTRWSSRHQPITYIFVSFLTRVGNEEKTRGKTDFISWKRGMAKLMLKFIEVMPSLLKSFVFGIEAAVFWIVLQSLTDWGKAAEYPLLNTLEVQHWYFVDSCVETISLRAISKLLRQTRKFVRCGQHSFLMPWCMNSWEDLDSQNVNMQQKQSEAMGLQIISNDYTASYSQKLLDATSLAGSSYESSQSISDSGQRSNLLSFSWDCFWW